MALTTGLPEPTTPSLFQTAHIMTHHGYTPATLFGIVVTAGASGISARAPPLISALREIRDLRISSLFL